MSQVKAISSNDHSAVAAQFQSEDPADPIKAEERTQENYSKSIINTTVNHAVITVDLTVQGHQWPVRGSVG